MARKSNLDVFHRLTHGGSGMGKHTNMSLSKALERKKESFSEKHAAYAKKDYSVAKDYKGRDIKVLKHDAKSRY